MILLILGYIGALFIGITLGLFGGGGGILAVPVLVYCFGVSAFDATFQSLFIVGITGIFGVYKNYQTKNIDTKLALLFAIPALLMVLVTRQLIMPAIPQVLFVIGTKAITKNILILFVFAVIMVIAAYKMIQPSSNVDDKNYTYSFKLLIIPALLSGFLTGFSGASGGFIIIPTLTLLFKMPIKKAIGTSLLIVTINTLLGFLMNMFTYEIQWNIVLHIIVLSIIGLFLGTFISKKTNPKLLKPVFGYFVLMMGIYIIVKELFF